MITITSLLLSFQIIISTSEIIENNMFQSSGTGYFTGDILLCNADEACTVDCAFDTGCSGAVINASLATSLTLDCTHSRSCGSSAIYCPSNGGDCTITCQYSEEVCDNTEFHIGGSNAVIECNGVGEESDIYEGYQSCIGLSITDDGIDNTQLSLKCNGYMSCSHADMSFTAEHVTSFNLECHQWGSCWGHSITIDNTIDSVDIKCVNEGGNSCGGPCTLNANNATNINLECLSGGGCDRFKVYGKYAGSVSITAATGDANTCGDYHDGGVWKGGYLDASNADNVEITCFASSTDSERREWIDGSCTDTTWKLPEESTINCVGKGCGDVVIERSNGFNGLTMNIYDSCDLCSNVLECLGADHEWLMGCSDGAISYHTNEGNCSGSITGDSNTCGCGTAAAALSVTTDSTVDADFCVQNGCDDEGDDEGDDDDDQGGDKGGDVTSSESVSRCFSSDSYAIVYPNYDRKAISSLNLFDKILTYDELNDVFVWDDLMVKLHFNEGEYLNKELVEMIQFELSNDDRLTMTGNHLLFIVDHNGLIRADQVKIGDKLKQFDGSFVSVMQITENVMRYPRNMITYNGNLVVNGIAISTFPDTIWGENKIWGKMMRWIMKHFYPFSIYRYPGYYAAKIWNEYLSMETREVVLQFYFKQNNNNNRDRAWYTPWLFNV